ncbi:mechanosensitive ion channel family protein [Holzapfeliella sp. JNUCC 80]
MQNFHLANLSGLFDWNKILDSLISIGIQVVITSVVFWIIWKVGIRLIKLAFAKQRKPKMKKSRQKTIESLLENIFRYFIIFCYIYGVLKIMGLPVDALLASAGILSVAIGLGAQGFFNDVVTGFFILAEQQIDVGDWVTIGAVSGTVTSVGIRTTQVQSVDGTLNYIPNRNITIVSNSNRGTMRGIVNFDLPTDVNIDDVKKMVEHVHAEMVPNYKDIIGEPRFVGAIKQSGNMVTYRTLIDAKADTQWQIQRDFLSGYLKEFALNGIVIPESNSVTLS